MRKGRLFTTLALTAALTASVFTPAAVSADDADYELVIELMTFGPTPADISEVEAAISEITSEKIGATVKFLPMSVADHATKVNLLAAGGEKVDLIMAGITSDPATLHSNGVLEDISGLLDEYAPNIV